MTDTTPARLAELRAVAEAAFPVEDWAIWGDLKDGGFVHVGNAQGVIPEGQFVTAEDAEPNPVAKAYTPELAAHIATFDPPTVLALIAALEAKTAEVEGYKQHYPCDGGCSYNDGPQEDCSRHGRNPRELWEIITQLARERDEAHELYRGACEAEDALNGINDALITRVEKAERERDEARAELAELAPSAAIVPTEEVVIDGYVFTWGDLPDVLSRTRESLTEARHEAKDQYIERRAAEAALERVRALHRKAYAIFSWSEGGVRYEEPCENCNGAPGVHDCGCWADVQIEYVCAECDRDKGKHRDSGWPCPTIHTLETGADDD